MIKKIINAIRDELSRWEFSIDSHDRMEQVKSDYHIWKKEYGQRIGTRHKSEEKE